MLVVTSVVGVVGAADAAADKLFSAKSRTLVILGGILALQLHAKHLFGGVYEAAGVLPAEERDDT